MSVSYQVPSELRLGAQWYRRIEAAYWIVMAALLLDSFLAHVANPYAFYTAILNYRIVGPSSAQWVAVFLPFLQFAVAMCLLTGLTGRTARLMGVALFLLFTAVQLTAIIRGLNINCGCFGQAERGINMVTIGETFVLLLVGAAYLCFPPQIERC
jgi:putative oxidoreductase